MTNIYLFVIIFRPVLKPTQPSTLNTNGKKKCVKVTTHLHLALQEEKCTA